MKNLFLLFCCAFSFVLSAQTDTIYYDIKWKRTNVRENASYYRVVDTDSVQKLYHVTDYYVTGEKKMAASFSSLDPEVKEGICTWYQKNGIKLQEVTFRKNVVNGNVVDYYDNGHIRSIKRYNAGKLANREFFSEDGVPVSRYTPMVEIPSVDFALYDKPELEAYAKNNIEWLLKNPLSSDQSIVAAYTLELIEKGAMLDIMLSADLISTLLADDSYENNSLLMVYLVLGGAYYQLTHKIDFDIKQQKLESAITALAVYELLIDYAPESKSKSLAKYLKLFKKGKLKISHLE